MGEEVLEAARWFGNVTGLDHLNQIEGCWDIVKDNLRRMDRRPISVYELWKDAEQLWDNIPQETVNHMVESMPRRRLNVLSASGNHIWFQAYERIGMNPWILSVELKLSEWIASRDMMMKRGEGAETVFRNLAVERNCTRDRTSAMSAHKVSPMPYAVPGGLECPGQSGVIRSVL